MSQPHKMVCFVPDKGNPIGRSRSEYIKLSLEKLSSVRHYEDLDWKDAYLKEVRIQQSS